MQLRGRLETWLPRAAVAYGLLLLLSIEYSFTRLATLVGGGTWMEADPDPLRVVKVETPTTVRWFSVPVVVMRWRVLEDS